MVHIFCRNFKKNSQIIIIKECAKSLKILWDLVQKKLKTNINFSEFKTVTYLLGIDEVSVD